ncbi:flagellar assembly protein FliX [Brevundimonas sp. 2R-24]|uniref:Flagellar assembly protein FliX n=1 Tax=Peiella sedimenti TaxID=3061083 RepID=A0ABT8SMX6_9CAUL|nr:flagellar assembly protein FliX [Caulobacteraceae bacterium XZ-24]
MRIERTGASPTATTPSSGRAGAAGFSLGGAGAPAAAAPAASAAGVMGVASVGALMALQGAETATERRRRAMRRASGILDRLEEVKLALLEGGRGEAALSGLARAVREERVGDEDQGLNQLLNQIEIRAAVELAKARLV